MAATLQQIDAMYGATPDHVHQRATPSLEHTSQDDESKSPLHGFDLLKNLSADKKLRADGQPPKRRGPKPDSKPALTRRQELNRQAQRTHRERKERYIAALEQEVLRLKEAYTSVTGQRDTYYSETIHLREILFKNGIDPGPYGLPNDPNSSTASRSASGYQGASSATSISPPPNGKQTQSPANDIQAPSAPPTQSLNYGQVGIDFVLALERPCMDHMQMLCTRALDDDAPISGHALMATAPTHHHLVERAHVPYDAHIETSDLLTLLDLSNRLALDGEITPVMAWNMIINHQHSKYFAFADFQAMADTLVSKVRCYGFGAVLEEFELNDAIANILASKSERFAIAP